MRIDWLRDCVNLGRTLNFTEAAKLSSIAQPAFSKHIKSAENEVGTPLFHRTKREVSLTPAGAIFVESAKHILEEYDGAMQNIASLQKNTKRVLKIGYLQGLMAHDLPRIQSRFSYEFPVFSSNTSHMNSMKSSRRLRRVKSTLPPPSYPRHWVSQNSVQWSSSRTSTASSSILEIPLRKRRGSSLKICANKPSRFPPPISSRRTTHASSIIWMPGETKSLSKSR